MADKVALRVLTENKSKAKEDLLKKIEELLDDDNVEAISLTTDEKTLQSGTKKKDFPSET